MHRWLISLLLCISSSPVLAFDHFISRQGHQLLDGTEEFRFAGLHAPELHRLEDDARGVCAADPRGWGQYFNWPTAEEQENWFQALSFTGHKAMRVYVLSVAHPADTACGRETHILPPATAGAMPVLNEKAMLVYDRMIALAEQYQIRLILPFIDHWDWWGGRAQLAAFYGETADDFYRTDSRTYQAYLDIIRQVIQRKNSFTGRLYSEEKAIMAWETGNELKDSTAEFVQKTVAQIKKYAPSQLVVDGTYLKIIPESLSNPQVDIISNHFYTTNNNNNPEQVTKDLAAIGGKKVYLIGEFGLTDTKNIATILQSAVHSEVKGAKTAGVFVWGWRGQRHNGGFYYHKEYTGHYSYRLPGFAEAAFNDEQQVVNLVRQAQATLAGKAQADALPLPLAPKLRAITDPMNIQWLGAAVAQHYRIERASSAQGPWQLLADKVSNAKLPFDPAKDRIFSDPTALKQQGPLYYRVIAVNETGQSAPSNIQRWTSAAALK
jgi:hypothetical protein